MPLANQDLDRIRDATNAAVERYHLPGIAIGVVQGDDLVFAEGFGYADIESGKPQDPNMRQRIGSITKTMVGLCAMALVEGGKLSLDERLVDRLPELTLLGPGEAVTVKHLLTHTAGIGEVPVVADLPRMEETLWCDEPYTTRIPESYPDGITIDVPPGTKWAYANHGFMLLGGIIARAEQAPIHEVLKRRVFGPLGMTDTDCLDLQHEKLTTGYHRAPSQDLLDLLARAGIEPPKPEEPVDGHNIRGRYQYVRGPAAGAVQSTIPDMARYASALLKKSAGIVKPATFDDMLAPHWRPDDRLVSMGLTFFRETRFRRRTFGHGGGVSGGWNTHICVVPEEDLALLTHCNLTFEDFAKVDGHILQAVLGETDVKLPKTAVDPALLAAAPGVYQATEGRLTNFRIATGSGRVQLSDRDGELVLHAQRGPWKDGAVLRPADPDDPAFFRLDTGEPEPPGLALVRDRSGAVTGLRFERLVEMVRSDGVEPWA